MNYALVLGIVFAVHVLAMASPSPNFLIVTQTAISGTRRAGVAAAPGVATAAALWCVAAFLGLSVLFTQLPWLYAGVKILGGLYLLYLGVKLWLGADQPLAQSASELMTRDSDRRAFVLGLVTNLTNPNALVYYASIFAAVLTPELPNWVRLAAIGIIVAAAISWHVAGLPVFDAARATSAHASNAGSTAWRARRWRC